MLRRWRTTWARGFFRRSLSALCPASSVVQAEQDQGLAAGDSLDLDQLENTLGRLEGGEAKASLDDYAFLLRQCGNLQSLSHGKRIHDSIVRNVCYPDRYLRNLIMEMYGKCGSPDNSAEIFRTILQPNIFSWTMLILGYGQNGQEKKALDAFRLMDLHGVSPTEVTFINILSICSRLGSLEEAKRIHSCLSGTGFESSVIVQTALFSMYARCSRLDAAKRIFDGMVERSVVSWNAMLTAYTQHGRGREALELFRRMDQEGAKPDEVTFLCLIEGCLGDLLEVNKIHRRIREAGYGSDIVLQTSILTFYGKHGCIEDARRVFDEMPCRNSVSWNAMIGVHAHHGYGKEAIELYERMKRDGAVKPDEVTFISVLDACACLGDIAIGKMVHADIVSNGLESVVILANSLMNMYGRCGSLEAARNVFMQMNSRILTSWNTMMAQYAEHGQGYDALDMFRQMQVEGVELDDITFISILSVCSHMGLLSEGRDLFFSLRQDYGFAHSIEHYGCMVDLLGRAGMLELAEELIDKIPFKSGPVLWTSLLNASRIHGDVDRGTRAAERVFELDPEDSGTYVILEQIYANAGRWDDRAKLKKAMKEKGIMVPDEQEALVEH